MKKLKQRLAWTLSNALQFVTGYYGLHVGIKWALNIFLFYSWFAITVIVITAFSDTVRKSCQKDGPSVPMWFNTMRDIGIVIATAAYGRFWLASFWVLHILCQSYIFAKPKEPSDEKA